MMKVHVYVMMAKRGIKTRKQLAEAAGVHQTHIGKIVDGKVKRVDLSTLEGLCRALDCQPGDLLEYVPDGDAKPSQSGPRTPG
jgi:putative transcriptional regulator